MSQYMQKYNVFIPHLEWRESNEWYWWRSNRVLLNLDMQSGISVMDVDVGIVLISLNILL
tara:strand:+ start:237 stop:416 length:180 start_codon:yes stop_codon:yes gene_type:complete